MKLIPINDELYIPNSRTGEDFGIFYRETMLGYYKTKEKAIEVLNEIQKQFDFKIENKCYEEADLLLKANMFPKIYQMPKE